MIQIKHGFQGQRMIILPFYLVDEMEQNPMMNDWFVHSLGYFPNARHHYIDRPSGCAEHIFMYCIKGKGWVEHKGEQHAMEENQFVILSPNTSHRYGSDGKEPWSIYWIHFKGYKSPLLSTRFDAPGTLRNNAGDCIKLFEDMYNVLDNSFDNGALSYANACLSFFMNTILYRAARKPTHDNLKYGTSVVNLATHYMNENIEKKLKLDDIAGYFGYSASYFYRLFYKSMKYAPMEYFNRLKIQRACYYLSNTSHKINEISSSLGFDDPYYFSRMFKKSTGVSPAKYRSSGKSTNPDCEPE